MRTALTFPGLSLPGLPMLCLGLLGPLAVGFGDAQAGEREDRSRSQAIYSEQGRSAAQADRSHGDESVRNESRRDDRSSQDRHADRGRGDDRHDNHDHRGRDWSDNREHQYRERNDDWYDNNHRHFRDYNHRDYNRHDNHYYYAPAPRRVIYFNDGYGYYRSYHLRNDWNSHFYDPFYFRSGIHLHAGCHYHHFGDAIAAGIVIGAILGDW